MFDAPPGLSATDGTSQAALCPSCKASRIGNFRFCLSCLQDFDQGSPRGLSDASLGMARARSAEIALAPIASLGMEGVSVASPATAPDSVASVAIAGAPSPAGVSSMTPPMAEAAVAASTAEATIAAATTETRVERGTRAEPITSLSAGRVALVPTGRRISRRLALVVAGIAIVLLGVTGALAIVLGRSAASGQLSGRPAAAAASPSAIPKPTPVPTSTPIPTPIPTYSTAIGPGPITFGTKLIGVTVSDPTTRIKVGRQVMWVARLSQRSIEPAVEISLAVVVSGKPIVIHREIAVVGVNGLLAANPGVNSRDLGPGTFVVRYTSQGTILAEGTFTVVK